MNMCNYSASQPASPWPAHGAKEETRRGHENGNQIVPGVSGGSTFAFMGGGGDNTISDLSEYNAMAGGRDNVVDFSSYTFIGGGRTNRIQAVSNHGVIAGGQDNLLGGGNQQHSFIGSGQNNIISSDHSSIIGGQNNTIPAGMPNTHIVGSGITAVNANSLHVNGLWANGIPGPGSTGLAPGTVYFDNITTLPFPWNTCNVLMIV